MTRAFYFRAGEREREVSSETLMEALRDEESFDIILTSLEEDRFIGLEMRNTYTTMIMRGLNEYPNNIIVIEELVNDVFAKYTSSTEPELRKYVFEEVATNYPKKTEWIIEYFIEKAFGRGEKLWVR